MPEAYQTLRLLLFSDCNRSCSGCCNKQWDLGSLPVCESYENWGLFLLTGGEPLLKPDVVLATVREIRKVNTSQIIVYTAKLDSKDAITCVLAAVDGMTLTLHEPFDVKQFESLLNTVPVSTFVDKSMRLNIFRSAGDISRLLPKLNSWHVKKDIEWIDNCPLPLGETFMRVKD